MGWAGPSWAAGLRAEHFGKHLRACCHGQEQVEALLQPAAGPKPLWGAPQASLKIGTL